MSRFTAIVERLQAERIALVEENRRKKTRSKNPRKKKSEPLKFDSPEIEAIFNNLPKDLQDHIRSK